MSDIYLQHLMTIIVSVFLRGYRGKTVDFSITSQHHRTTVAYFLNHGKWNDSALQKALKSSIVELIYQEARSSGQPIFCIVDDTIASHINLRHRICIQSKRRIFINRTSKDDRIMDTRLFLLCFPAMESR